MHRSHLGRAKRHRTIRQANRSGRSCWPPETAGLPASPNNNRSQTPAQQHLATASNTASPTEYTHILVETRFRVHAPVENKGLLGDGLPSTSGSRRGRIDTAHESASVAEADSAVSPGFEFAFDRIAQRRHFVKELFAHRVAVWRRFWNRHRVSACVLTTKFSCRAAYKSVISRETEMGARSTPTLCSPALSLAKAMRLAIWNISSARPCTLRLSWFRAGSRMRGRSELCPPQAEARSTQSTDAARLQSPRTATLHRFQYRWRGLTVSHPSRRSRLITAPASMRRRTIGSHSCSIAR